jgi:hypothetical protein
LEVEVLEKSIVAELVFENGKFARLSNETSEQLLEAVLKNRLSGSSLITDGQTTYNMSKVLRINWIQS